MIHNYVAYTRGCRCDICRQAKAEYMRARRTAGRAAARRYTTSSTDNRPTRGTAFDVGATRYIARVDNHGTRCAYEEHGCRCEPCTRARTGADARYRRGRSEVAP